MFSKYVTTITLSQDNFAVVKIRVFVVVAQFRIFFIHSDNACIYL